MKKLVCLFVSIIVFLQAGGCDSMMQCQSREKENLKFRIMTYNILFGGKPHRTVEWPDGTKTLRGSRVEELKKVVKSVDPDILCLQECSGWADNDEKILKDVAKSLGMNGVISRGDNNTHVAVLSKYEIRDSYCLNKDYAHYILYADVCLPNGQILKVLNIHFGWWGVPGYRKFTEEKRAESYKMQKAVLLGELVKNSDELMAVTGDMNHLPQTTNFGEPPFYEEVLTLGYTDCYFNKHKNYEGVFSFAMKEPAYPGPIDFVFVTKPLESGIKDAGIFKNEMAYKASDHLPVWVDFELK